MSSVRLDSHERPQGPNTELQNGERYFKFYICCSYWKWHPMQELLRKTQTCKLKRRSLSSLDLVVFGAIMNTVYETMHACLRLKLSEENIRAL